MYCYLDILSVSKISDCLLIGVLYVQAIKINKKIYIYTARSHAFISRSREVLSRPLAPARFYPARSREVLSRPLPRGFIPPARSREVLSHPLAPRFYPARSREVLSRPLQRGFYPARSREVFIPPARSRTLPLYIQFFVLFFIALNKNRKAFITGRFTNID